MADASTLIVGYVDDGSVQGVAGGVWTGRCPRIADGRLRAVPGNLVVSSSVLHRLSLIPGPRRRGHLHLGHVCRLRFATYR